jgi:hypothetical protein
LNGFFRPYKFATSPWGFDWGFQWNLLASLAYNYKIGMNTMKKALLGTLISTALATTLSANTNAATYAIVVSDISAIQLWTGDIDVMTAEAPGHFTDLHFGGTAADLDDDGYVDEANIHFSGIVGFTINTIDIRLTYNLYRGDFTPGLGITFGDGNIQIEVSRDGSGWQPYGSIDADTETVGFLANQPGGWAGMYPEQVTAGIVRNALPGLWDGPPGSAGFDRAASSFVLLGLNVGFYMQGSITPQLMDVPQQLAFGPPEVPLPGAAWLFGSALAGVAGLRRRRA